MIDKKTIEEIGNKLADAYQPLRIYLFGSYAWGVPSEDSDLDLLVIVEKSDEKSYKRPRKGLLTLRGMGVAKDLIVYTRKEFNDFSKQLNSLAYKIQQDGVLLYERN